MLESYRNMNEADFEKIGETYFKSQDGLKNGEMSDELLDLFLPKRVAPVRVAPVRVAPQGKCARFCNCLRSLFGC